MNAGRVKIVHEGKHRYPFDPEEEDWQWILKGGLGEEEADHYRRIIMEGEYQHEDGTPLGTQEARWTRDLLLGRTSGIPRVATGLHRRSGPEGRRHLLEGLWPWGTYTMLAGTYKAGKTGVVADLVAALLNPGRLFLGRFPVTLTDEERARGIVVINAETPAEDFENALVAAGVHPEDQRIRVYHLDDEAGGPSSFDLTDDLKSGEWGNEFMECFECPDDFSTPVVVIVDGVAAIMGNQDSYEPFYAALKKLMKAIAVPNALATGHAVGDHLYGATAAMGGSDGVWGYTKSRPDDPMSARFFHVLPREGGTPIPKTRVRLVDGLLQLDAQKEGAVEEPASDPERERDARMLKKVRSKPDSLTTELTGRGRDGGLNNKSLLRLKDAGLISSRPGEKGRGKLWSRVEQPEESDDDEIIIDLSGDTSDFPE